MQQSTLDTVDILLIEDNEDDFVILESFLSQPEFAITWCVNAGDARENLKREAFDIVLLDHGLPDANALSLLEEIHIQHPELPVIVLTGHDDQALAISAIKLGAANYILKDEISDHLMWAIEDVLGEKGLTAGTETAPVSLETKERFVDTADRVYRALIETMNEGCFIIDPQGIITFVNQALGSLVGIDSHHLLGRNALNIFTPQTRSELRFVLGAAAQTRDSQTRTIEGNIPQQDGSEASVLLSITHMYSAVENENYEASMVILTDVTDLVRTKQKLDQLYQKEHENNRKLQILHKISTSVSDLNSDRLVAHTCDLISREFDYYKVTIGLVSGDKITIEQKHRDPQSQTATLLLENNAIGREENNIMATAVNEGRIVYVPDLHHSPYHQPELHSRTRAELAVPILSKDECIGVLDVQSDRVDALEDSDILLLRLMAEYLANSLENARLFQTITNERSRLQALIASSYDGIVFFTMDMCISIINSQAVAFLQLPGDADNWVNRPLSDALSFLKNAHSSVAEVGLTEMRRIKAGNHSANQGEFKVPPRNLTWYHIPISVGDDTLGWVLVLRDVSAERLAEKMRQDLTHAMVHDLRNPLTAISLSLELINNYSDRGAAELSVRQRKQLNNSLNITQRLSTLVNNILDVSKMESGQMPLRIRSIDLNELVEETVKAQGILLAKNQLSLNYEIPSALPLVMGDFDVIGRVMQNLLDNAIKFSPDGGRVFIAVAPWTAGDGNASHLKLSVSDTGPGISLDLRDHLFEKFVTGAGKGKGSGLGLAFCKLAVEAHKGRIWVENRPGKGTTFSFTLPVAP